MIVYVLIALGLVVAALLIRAYRKSGRDLDEIYGTSDDDDYPDTHPHLDNIGSVNSIHASGKGKKVDIAYSSRYTSGARNRTTPFYEDVVTSSSPLLNVVEPSPITAMAEEVPQASDEVKPFAFGGGGDFGGGGAGGSIDDSPTDSTTPSDSGDAFAGASAEASYTPESEPAPASDSSDSSSSDNSGSDSSSGSSD